MLYGEEGRDTIYLDQCTKELAVERRRIYDIINILESFNVIRRTAKNSYQWKGIHFIVQNLQALIVRYFPINGSRMNNLALKMLQ